MALSPWNVLAGGKIRTDAEEDKRRQTGEKGRAWTGTWERNEKEKKISRALEKVAAEIGAKHINSGMFVLSVLQYRCLDLFLQLAVAIAYLMQKAPYVFPIVGGRKVEHLLANLEALEISLTEEQIKSLESEVEFEPGFPSWFIVRFCCLFTSYVTHGHVFTGGRKQSCVPYDSQWPHLQPAPPTSSPKCWKAIGVCESWFSVKNISCIGNRQQNCRL